MKQGEFDQLKPINPQRLNEEIKALLGDKLVSMDTGVTVKVGFLEKKVILVRLADDATEADQTAVESAIAAHDPAVKSAGQQHNENVAAATARLKAVDLKVNRDKGNVQEQIADLYALIADIQLWIQGERTD